MTHKIQLLFADPSSSKWSLLLSRSTFLWTYEYIDYSSSLLPCHSSFWIHDIYGVTSFSFLEVIAVISRKKNFRGNANISVTTIFLFLDAFIFSVRCSSFFFFWQFLPSFWFYVFTSCDLMFLCWSRTNQFVLLWSFRPPDLASNDFCFELSLIIKETCWNVVEERFDLSDDVIKHQRNRRRVNVWRNQCSSRCVIVNEESNIPAKYLPIPPRDGGYWMWKVYWIVSNREDLSNVM